MAGPITSAQGGYWDVAATWSPAQVPTSTDDVTIAVGHTVTNRDATQYAVSNLTINGTLTHSANSTTALGERYKINLIVNADFTLNTGGAINVDGMGYAGGQGPGAGGLSTYSGNHGGIGDDYQSGTPANSAKPCYGSINAPTNLGSGGDGAGGGAIRLTVAGNSSILGTISANGGTCSWRSGAGGSVYITTATISGTNVISANGGTTTGGSGYGGGGRIAVILTGSGANFSGFSGSINAWGGPQSSYSGGAGTVYKKILTQTYGDLIIDNNNYTPGHAAATTRIDTGVTGTTIGSLVVRNGGQLEIQAAQTLAVTGDFTNNSSTAQIGGTFLIGGTGTSLMGGTVKTTLFCNVTCTNAGKTINFTGGNTYGVTNLLTLTGALNGSTTNWVTLRSTSASCWNLNVAAGVLHQIRYVDAQLSNAKGGAPVQAMDSIDSGNNTNWIFASAGQVNTWNGSVSTNWYDTGNWSLVRPTVSSDAVVIPTNSSLRYPALDNTKFLAALAISNGASLRLSGYNLTVTGSVANAGALVPAGGETITVGGNLDFTGGTFTQCSTTVIIGGGGAESITSAGNKFSSLIVTNTAAAVTFTDTLIVTNSLVNSGGSVTFSGPVTAGTFTNTGALTFGDNLTAASFFCSAGGRTLTFHAGSDYTTTTNLEFYGARGNLLTLRSSSDGSAWRLNSSNFNAATYVDVKDSDARGGLTIYPILSTNTGNNNLNWDFSETTNWIAWNGTSSIAFATAANWTPTGAPSAGSMCLIDGWCTYAPTISSATGVARMAVGGPLPVTLTVNAPLTVSRDVTILRSATVTHTLNAGSETYKVNITAGSNLTLRGAINVDGMGYAANQGTGHGGGGATGGNHGGIGYANSAKPCYGSIIAPTNLGSGGDGAGGGAIRLTVAGNSGVFGPISANGGNTSWRSGAGGSVYITTATISGPGAISANGGICGSQIGGGGRIAVILTGSGAGFSDFSGSMAASGAGTTPGGAGTVYKKTLAQTYGDLIIDNNNSAAAASDTTRIDPGVTDTVVGTVILQKSGKLEIATNQLLTVNGSWSNAATFLAGSNSTVTFVGTNAATVWGNNTFSRLSIGDTGTKPLTFQAGKTNTVQGDLAIYKAVLGSTSTGQWWYLTVTNNATQSRVQSVMVRDSNATNGAQIVVTRGGTDLGHNVNWKFIPPPGTLISLR